MEDQIYIYIDVLAASTRTVVQRFREPNRELNYVDIFRLASEEGTSRRASNHRGDTKSPVSWVSPQSCENSLG